MAQKKDTPLLVIIGETASGKSALALEIAEKFRGEIIASDSRTVYEGMDIGTAKPSHEEQASVPHHLIDVTTPDKPITAADFQRLANEAVADISSRGKLPILVGGTGLYVDSVLFNYQFNQSAAERDEVNPRHLKNADQSDRKAMRPDALVVGLQLDRDVVKQKITARTEAMFAAGLENEARKLVEHYGWVSPLQTIGYQEFRDYFAGEQTLEQTKAKIVQDTVQYAKRQRTWFKRNESIHWFKQQSEAVDFITTVLNKYYKIS